MWPFLGDVRSRGDEPGNFARVCCRDGRQRSFAFKRLPHLPLPKGDPGWETGPIDLAQALQIAWAIRAKEENEFGGRHVSNTSTVV